MTERVTIGSEPWKESIFGCCTDLSTCCYGCFCTPCLFGETNSKTSKDEGGCSGCCGYCLLCWGCCCCIVHKPARIHFREAYGLQEGHGLANDFCASWCCSPCGVCQEARERKTRGDPPMKTFVGHVRNQPATILVQPGVKQPVAGVVIS